MKTKLVLDILGRLLIAFAVFMLFPLIYAVIHQESVQIVILESICLTGLAGLSMVKIGSNQGNIGVREGFLIVAGAWLLTGFFGSFPFWLSKAVPSYLDAWFETVSGLTTTGASIINDVESLPGSIILWRSMTHWLGGMGIIVLFVAFLTNIGVGAVNLLRAEIPGPKVERVMPRIRHTAITLWLLYTAFTVAEIILLAAAGMSWFDAVNHTFATLATGGFSTKNASIKHYDSYTIELIIVFFMFLAGGNFSLYFLVWKKGLKRIFRDTEFRAYCMIIVCSVLIIAGTLYLHSQDSWLLHLRQALFQVVSVMTTTGFATADFDQWPSLAKMILFMLMFIGGCAGSTAGGIKVIRLIILSKDAIGALVRAVHPRIIRSIRVDNNAVEFDVITATAQFFYIYITTYIVSVLLVAATGMSAFDSMSAVAATLGNIGPGFGVVGPTTTYATVAPFAKFILTIDMLLGRLELFTLLVLLHPEFWQPYLTRSRSQITS